MPPTSQKYRSISVSLDGEVVPLTLRPEDLNWSEPSRTAVQNTLGDAWVDSFGPAIAVITIAGHTGWAGRHGAGGDTGPDWAEQFAALHRVAFKQWHEKVEATRDPEAVELLFIDTLDSRCVRVIPQTFVLRRSKQRPLLMQYTITFLVVRDAGSSSGSDSEMAEALELGSGGDGSQGGQSQLEQLSESMGMTGTL